MVLTAFECLLFAILLAATNKEKALSTYFLVGFLLAHVLITLHELTFWGSQFRIWLLNHSPNYFFIGSYAYFLDGCLLYFFVRAMLFKDFALKKQHAWHLLPVGVYLSWMIFIFYSKDYSQKYWLIESQHIAYSSPYLYLESAGRYLRLLYALLCFSLIFNYSKQLQHVYANLKLGDLVWLKIMLVSFVALFAWDSVLLSIKLAELFIGRFDLDLLNIVGLSGYYLNFAVINILIFLKFILFSSVQSVDEEPTLELKEEKTPAIDPQSISNIEQVMTEKKYYTNPDITLDKLASAVKLQPKKLSLVLKVHYQLNFYQFINRYRISEAKQLLARRDYADKTITDIYLEVGFNNKSVFNSFFKRSEGMTPSEYRDRQLRNPG
ncbi:MAG: helix-turn-helix domain-containing protein [Cellvibrio sp.]|uniref:helix-turn-helix domain-containing protein n=1 Tax=Cellvibrio sp. TaxID=1965322 RepID=UPI0031A2CA2D